MANQNEFYLSSEQWMRIFNENFKTLEHYNFFIERLYVNNKSFLNFLKNSEHQYIKKAINSYFSPENIMEHSQLLLKYKSNIQQVSESDLIKHENLIKKYCDILSSINLYDISIDFINIIDFNHPTNNNTQIYKKLFEYGLDIPQFFTPYALEMTHQQIIYGKRNFLNFWFDGHTICNKKPDKIISLHLIKYIEQHNPSLDIIKDKFKYLNLLDKDTDTFNYLQELKNTTYPRASFLKLIHKEFKKYPQELYQEVAQIFEDKRAVQTEINNYYFTKFSIDAASLTLSGTLKSREAENFVSSFLMAIKNKIKSSIPNIEIIKNMNDINFITKSLEDKENVNKFLEVLNSSLIGIISQYNHKLSPNINTEIIIKSIDSILFSINLDKKLDNKNTTSKGNKL